MAVGLKRDQIIHLILEFESDLRRLLERHVLFIRNEEQALASVSDKVAERKRRDGGGGAGESDLDARSVDFLDLGDEISLLRRWFSDLPPDSQNALRDIRDADRMIAIRNRVMHNRPLLEDDRTFVLRTLDELLRGGLDAPRLKNAMDRFRNDPEWWPASPEVASDARVLHNLPRSDFEDIGLIGRVQEQRELFDLLVRLPTTRSRIVTLVGPGGSGKTALALQVLDNLVYDHTCPYDLVAWVSLKTEELTPLGVSAIADAVTDMTGAAAALMRAIDDGADASLIDLASALEGLQALIVIDNIETVDGSEIIDFTDALPDETSFLLTSRVGLGQMERVYPVGPLKEASAAHLLRCLFEDLGVQGYANVSNDLLIRDFIRAIGTAPLALRWLAASIAAGSDPHALVQHDDDLVRFCIENVFTGLDATSQRVVRVISATGRPLMAMEIAQFMTDLDFDSVRRSLQALQTRNLLQVSSLSGTTQRTYDLSAGLADYVTRFSPLDAASIAAIRAEETRLRRDEERQREWQRQNPFTPSALRGGDEHKIAKSLLDEALKTLFVAQRTKSLDAAESTIADFLARAAELDASYWEVPRVAAYVDSRFRRYERAQDHLEQALALAPTELDKAYVRFWFAQFLTDAGNADLAIVHAQIAHDVIGTPDTAIVLGTPLMYARRYDDAEQLFISARVSDHARTRDIAGTLLVDLRRRIAERARYAGEIDDARAAVNAAYDVADEIATDPLAMQLAKHLGRLSAEALRIARGGEYADRSDDLVRRVLEWVRRIPESAQTEASLAHVRKQAFRLWRERNLSPDLRVGLEPLAREYQNAEAVENPDMPRVAGTIRNWRGDLGYGFVSCDAIDEDVAFLHATDLRDLGDRLFMTVGRNVEFSVGRSDKGAKAFDVVLVDPPLAAELVARDAEVVEIRQARVVLRDHITGTRLDFRRDAAPQTASVGTRVKMDISRRDGEWHVESISA